MGAANGHLHVGGLGRRDRSVCLSVVLVLFLFVAACSSDDDSGSGDGREPDKAEQASVDDNDGDDEAEPTTTSSPPEPDANHPDEVAPHLRELLRRYDEVVTRIVADPEVANDADDPLVEEFLSLFESGSEFADGSLEAWQRYAGTGVTVAPLSEGEPVSETKIEGPMYPVDEDEITFGQCTVLQYVLYRNGDEAERAERRPLPGNGRAVRLDGRWVLVDISTPRGIEGCLTEGGGPE